MGVRGQKPKADQTSQKPELSRSDSHRTEVENRSLYGFDRLREKIESYDGWKVFAEERGEQIIAVNNSEDYQGYLELERESDGWTDTYSLTYSERDTRLGPSETVEESKTSSWYGFSESVEELLE